MDKEPGAAAAREVVKITDKTYRSEYYKKNYSWGVKQCFASRRQIFSIGGLYTHKSKASLKKIVDKAIEKMENGASEEDTKIWAKAEADK